MKKQFLEKLFVLLLILTVGLTVSSCSDDDDSSSGSSYDPTKAESLVDEARAELETQLYGLITSELSGVDRPSDIDFSKSYALYSEALTYDPENKDAKFGVSFTSILNITQDADVNEAFDAWNNYMASRNVLNSGSDGEVLAFLPLGFPVHFSDANVGIATPLAISAHLMTASTTDSIPQLEDAQEILEDVVLPVLTSAISRLDEVDDDASFKFMITPKMQGDENEDSVEIDLTEIYAMEAVLNMLKSSVLMTVAYDISMDGYDSTGVSNALTQSTTSFMALRTNGKTYMSAAKTALLSAADKMDAAIAFLEAEQDDQSNDIIKIGGDDGVSESEMEKVTDATQEIRDAFSSPIEVKNDFNGDGSTQTLKINLAAIFDNPIENFKELLPEYSLKIETENGYLSTTITWTATDFSSWTIPNPTFNGLFPELTTDEKFKEFFGIDGDGWKQEVQADQAALLSIIPDILGFSFFSIFGLL
ncbi:hypothetical protein [Chloroherpeton thalassium]|nr:hypothetical protein [Chloroherpeton thalassium]